MVPLVLSLNSLSLGTRLTLLAVATLSPIVVLTVFSYFQDREEQRDAALRDVASYSQSLASGLENFARDLDSFSQAAALALGSRGEPLNNANAQPYLAALVRQNDFIEYIFVTDLDGRVIAQNSGDDTGIDLSGRSYIQELEDGAETTWSGGLQGLRSGTVTVAYARTIRNSEGAPVAYLVAAFYPAGLSERFPDDISADDHLIVVDQHGQLVYSSRAPDLEDLPRDFSQSPNVQAALGGQAVAIENAETAFDEGDRFGSFVPIPRMKWALGYTRSQSNLENSLSESLQRDLMIVAVIGALSVGALMLVSRQITRPLVALSAAVTGMKDRKPLEELRMTSEPDIARLQRAFLDMRKAVQAREAALADQTRVLDTLDQVGASLASSLDLDVTVQSVTDAGTRLTGATYGAFFYNAVGDDGEIYQLFALSGADKSEFERFGMPRATGLFGPTFRGEGVVRMADVTVDPRYGKNRPFAGMPVGHLPVRSYLAVPVTASGGRVIGGLFFGHPEPDRFNERHERLAVGIASWGAIAFDNARLYREAQKVQEELLAANRTKDEFLSLVSHELRTPITVIALGASRLLRSAQMLEEEQVAVLDDVVVSAARLSELVQNLLVLARPGSVTQVEPEPVLVRAVIQNASEQFRERRKDRVLIFDSAADDAVVMGSSIYLEQIVLNLLSNADKYSPHEEPVTITLRADRAFVSISVEDRGPGLDQEEVEHFCEPYYRGEQARKVAGGFGLGLAVCQRLAETMRGRLDYRSLEGKGACFTVTLPRTTIDIAEEPAEHESTQARAAV